AGGNGGGDFAGGFTIPANAIPMVVSKLQGSAKFTSSGHDTCSVSGIIPNLPAQFTVSGPAVLNINGATQNFTVDAKGHGKATNGTFALKLKVKRSKTSKQS